jgi:hypothetical protein
MTRPLARAAASFAALWLLVACLDISSPLGGISSISSIIAPSPSVILGDVSRDTLGNEDSLRVYAFDAKGDTVRDAQVTFVVIDTLSGLTIDEHGVAHGGKLSPGARVVARVSPAGSTSQSLQTTPFVLPVTIAPNTVKLTSTDTLFITATDSVAFSKGVSVKVLGVDGTTPVNSYLVRYTIDSAPAAKPGATSAFLAGDDNKAAVANDTSSASGDASRKVALRRSALADDAVWATAKPDSVIVRVRVQYKGADVSGSPIRVVIPLRLKVS